MNDNEFQLEIENLMREERKKEPFYLISLRGEQQKLIELFESHYETLSQLKGASDIDSFLSSITAADTDSVRVDINEDLYSEINELVHRDLERYLQLLEGELLMRGEGLFLYDPDIQEEFGEQPVSAEVYALEKDMAVSGEFSHFTVAPMIPYEIFHKIHKFDTFDELDDEDLVSEMPGLWLALKNATVNDASGFELESCEMVLVPMNYPTMRLHKVVRQGEPVGTSKKTPEGKAPVITHLQSGFIKGVFSDKENDLNYNDYNQEEFEAARELHKQEIGVYMSAVEQNVPISLFASDSYDVNGSSFGPISEIALYRDSSFIKISNQWRVAHQFVIGSDNIKMALYVLPEDISPVDQEHGS